MLFLITVIVWHLSQKIKILDYFKSTKETKSFHWMSETSKYVLRANESLDLS